MVSGEKLVNLRQRLAEHAEASPITEVVRGDIPMLGPEPLRAPCGSFFTPTANVIAQRRTRGAICPSVLLELVRQQCQVAGDAVDEALDLALQHKENGG